MPRRTNRKLTTIQIPQEDAAQLSDIAEKLAVPRQSVIRWAIKAYVDSFVPSVVLNSTSDTIQQAADADLVAA